MKSPKLRNRAQRKVDYKKYDAIIKSRNYVEKLLQEIMRRNYYRKLSASILMTRICGNYRDTAYPKSELGLMAIYLFIHKYIYL